MISTPNEHTSFLENVGFFIISYRIIFGGKPAENFNANAPDLPKFQVLPSLETKLGVAKTQWCRTGRHECWIYSLPFLQISAVSGDWKIGSWMLSNVYNIYMNITEYIYISYPSTLATMLYHITYVQNYIRKYHDKLRINRYHRYHSYNTSWNLVFSQFP